MSTRTPSIPCLHRLLLKNKLRNFSKYAPYLLGVNLDEFHHSQYNNAPRNGLSGALSWLIASIRPPPSSSRVRKSARPTSRSTSAVTARPSNPTLPKPAASRFTTGNNCHFHRCQCDTSSSASSPSRSPCRLRGPRPPANASDHAGFSPKKLWRLPAQVSPTPGSPSSIASKEKRLQAGPSHAKIPGSPVLPTSPPHTFNFHSATPLLAFSPGSTTCTSHRV